MANSGPSLRPASEASGAARAKHSTGMPVRNPNSTGVNPRSSSSWAITGATATNGPRMFSAISPIASMRSQPRGARATPLMGRAVARRPGRNMISSVPLLSRAPAATAECDAFRDTPRAGRAASGTPLARGLQGRLNDGG